MKRKKKEKSQEEDVKVGERLKKFCATLNDEQWQVLGKIIQSQSNILIHQVAEIKMETPCIRLPLEIWIMILRNRYLYLKECINALLALRFTYPELVNNDNGITTCFPLPNHTRKWNWVSIINALPCLKFAQILVIGQYIPFYVVDRLTDIPFANLREIHAPEVSECPPLSFIRQKLKTLEVIEIPIKFHSNLFIAVDAIAPKLTKILPSPAACSIPGKIACQLESLAITRFHDIDAIQPNFKMTDIHIKATLDFSVFGDIHKVFPAVTTLHLFEPSNSLGYFLSPVFPNAIHLFCEGSEFSLPSFQTHQFPKLQTVRITHSRIFLDREIRVALARVPHAFDYQLSVVCKSYGSADKMFPFYQHMGLIPDEKDPNVWKSPPKTSASPFQV
jgi:hypothetical protein